MSADVLPRSAGGPPGSAEASADSAQTPPGAAGGPTERPFDGLAGTYDDAFTRSFLGRLMRRAVWRRLRPMVTPGARVLDLGCGTGEDAVRMARAGARVLAVDASAAMVERARAKAAEAGDGPVGGRVDTRQLRAEALGGLTDLDREGSFDVVLSNFGVLNCVDDLEEVGRALARCTRPGARVLLCVMGPVVPWEWGWFLARGEPAEAFRRLRPGGVAWRGMPVRYPTPGTLRRALGPAFRQERLSAVGALVPPPYAEGWARRHPRLVRRLDRWERRLEAVPPLPRLADHYLLEAVREARP